MSGVCWIEIQHLASNIIFQSSPTCLKGVFKKSALFTTMNLKSEERKECQLIPQRCAEHFLKDTTQTWPESEVGNTCSSERPKIALCQLQVKNNNGLQPESTYAILSKASQPLASQESYPTLNTYKLRSGRDHERYIIKSCWMNIIMYAAAAKSL